MQRPIEIMNSSPDLVINGYSAPDFMHYNYGANSRAGCAPGGALGSSRNIHCYNKMSKPITLMTPRPR